MKETRIALRRQLCERPSGMGSAAPVIKVRMEGTIKLSGMSTKGASRRWHRLPPQHEAPEKPAYTAAELPVWVQKVGARVLVDDVE